MLLILLAILLSNLRRLQPSILSLWDHFSEYEAHAMENLPGTFPVAIGLRLKTSKYYGTLLFAHNISYQNCHINAHKIMQTQVAHLPHETHRVSSLMYCCQRQLHYNHGNYYIL